MMKKLMTPSVSPSRGGLLSRRFQQIAKCAGAIILGSVALLGASSLSSCSDDLDIRVNNGYAESGITLMIPDVEAAYERAGSRAEEANVQSGEGTINDLWLYVFKKGTVNNTYTLVAEASGEISAALKNQNNNASDLLTYRSYKLQLGAGTYKFYLLGNVDAYRGSTVLSDLNSIGDIERLNLTFSDFIEADNLPMACLSDLKVDNNACTEVTISDAVAVSGKTIYADMTFLCAKVRATILFDKTGFSNKFSSNKVDFATSVASANVHSETPVVKPTSSSNELIKPQQPTGTIHRIAYPSNGTIDKDASYTEKTESWNTEDQRAWQGIFYIPENITSSAENTGKTTLTFKPADNGTEGMQESYTMTLVDKNYKFNNSTPNSNDGIHRGHFYDIVAKLTTPGTVDLETTVSVEDWTPVDLQYALHGPYELIVETTTIEVKSGQWSDPFWYKSDVAPGAIRFAMPKINIGTASAPNNIDFYEVEVVKASGSTATHPIYATNTNGNYQIHARVNPRIPFDKLPAPSELTPYKYFEIIAGTLQKKIEVEPLSVEGFLTVTPKKIIVDMREYITSGIDSNTIDIEIATNISNSLTVAASDNGIYTISDTNPFGISAKADSGTTLTGTTATRNITITEGIGILSLDIMKIFEGIHYWKQNHTYTLTFSVTSGTLTETEQVEITVKPYTTDYIIHFKPELEDWGNPHIYVYQCLELPSDLTGTNSQYAGMTVGYGNNIANANAGLEYAFSNNISFKGWQGYGGTVNPNQTGTTKNFGFVNMGGASNAYQFQSGHSLATNTYNYATDLNSAHEKGKDMWSCGHCAAFNTISAYNGGSGSRLFPGVAMEYEENGWYKYTLTGVATPGKTLIMFYNDHAYNNDDHRYPNKKDGKDPVGITLFDYPNNEGWLKYDGNKGNRDQNFSATEPTTTKMYAYRLYWYSTNSTTSMFLNEGASNSETTRYQWSNGYRHEGSNWHYIQFYSPNTNSRIRYRVDNVYGGDNNGNGIAVDNGLSKFKPDNNGISYVKYAYLDQSGNLQEGMPDTSKAPGSSGGGGGEKIYRFYWPLYLGEFIHLWTEDGTNQGAFTNYDTTTGTLDPDLGYFYFEIPNSEYKSGQLKYKINKEENNQSLNITLDQFGQDGTSNYYCANILTSGGTVTTQKPSSILTLNRSSDYLFRGDNNGFGDSDSFTKEYEHDSNGYHIWRITGISLGADKGFKLAKKDWNDSFNYGSNNNKIKNNSFYEPSQGSGTKNIILESSFSGICFLVQRNNKYYIYLASN